jgi:hypothetical protein
VGNTKTIGGTAWQSGHVLGYSPMFKVTYAIGDFMGLSGKQQAALPRATSMALNNAMFDVREGWRKLIPLVFDRPVPLTLNAVLYKKSTPVTLTAEVFIREEITKGSPPARYLHAEVTGGPRRQKAFEKALARHPRTRAYYVPGKGAKLDAYGNVPSSVIGKILSQLAVRSDVYQNETLSSRYRRLRKQRKKGGGGSYFILAKNRGKLKAGVIYERMETAFGSAVRSVLYPVDSAPTYRVRFDPIGLTRKLFYDSFRARFHTEFERVMKLRG